jgi:hypothetical protein
LICQVDVHHDQITHRKFFNLERCLDLGEHALGLRFGIAVIEVIASKSSGKPPTKS